MDSFKYLLSFLLFNQGNSGSLNDVYKSFVDGFLLQEFYDRQD